MTEVNILTAFIAGIVSFLSPCVLPLVPGYISYMSGLSLERLTGEAERTLAVRRAGVGSFFFVLGFAVVFTFLGASASAVGKLLKEWMPVLAKVAGAVVIVFGFHVTGLIKIKWLYYEKRLEAKGLPPGVGGAFVMGLAFAFGWTPCIGPILAAILALAATQESVAKGMGLLFIYSMGLGIPFIITGFSVNGFLRFFGRFKRFIRATEIFSGVLLVVIGVLIFTKKLTWLIQFFPDWLFKFAL